MCKAIIAEGLEKSSAKEFKKVFDSTLSLKILKYPIASSVSLFSCLESASAAFFLDQSLGKYKNKASINKKFAKNKNSEEGLVYLFLNGVKEHNIKLKNPEVTLYMIVELVSSTCFNSILYNEPLPIEEFKPYLYELIRNLLKE